MTRHTPTRGRYVAGCRCQACKAANSAWMAAWRARRKQAGTHRLLHGYWIAKDAS